MNERIEKIKQHFKDNKVVYIVGVGCTTLGAVSTLAIVSSPLVSNRLIQVLTYKSNQTLEVFIEALGDPGNIIQDTTTGIIYASQNQAAKELGVLPSRISEHLQGKLPNVKGHTLTKLGKAMVAE
jgi:hypothetical protein